LDGRAQGSDRVAQACGAPSVAVLDYGDREGINDQIRADRRLRRFETGLAIGIARKNRRRFKLLDPIALRVEIDDGSIDETVGRNNIEHSAFNSAKSP
jgi:hypothetical protein